MKIDQEMRLIVEKLLAAFFPDTVYNINVYINVVHCNFICSLSDIIIKTFSHSVSHSVSACISIIV